MNNLKVNSWPSGTQCIAWSFLGELALACGENIELLIPRFERSSGARIGESPWSKVRLLVTEFSEEDRPSVEPQGFSNWSIGEEIAAPTVQSISWSAAGIAKHVRPALAVLTTNLVLAVWECNDRPEFSTGWQRSLIANHMLVDYFKNADDEQPGEITNRRTRIRAFAWAPALCHQQDVQLKQLLAVANDFNEILLLHVKDGPGALSAPRSSALSIAVVACFQAFELAHIPGLEIHTFDGHMHRERFPLSLSWSPWYAHGRKQAVGILAYCSRNQVCMRETVVHGESVGTSAKISVRGSISSPYAVKDVLPISWYPRMIDGHCHLLVNAAKNRLLCISVGSGKPPNFSTVRESHLDTSHWHALSGMAFTGTTDAQVHLTFVLSTGNPACLSFTLPDLQPISPQHIDTTWHSKLLDWREMQTLEAGFGRDSTIRTWGISSLPAYDLVAVCFTVHPSHQVEYLIASEQRTYIDITKQPGNKLLDFGLSGVGEMSSLEDLSSEAILLGMKMQGQNTVTSGTGNVTGEEMLNMLIVAFNELVANASIIAQEAADVSTDGSVSTQTRVVSYLLTDRYSTAGTVDAGSVSITALIHDLRTTLYRDEDILRARCRYLMELARSVEPSNNAHVRALIEAIARQLNDLPSHFTSSSLSKQIVRNYTLASKAASDEDGASLATKFDQVEEKCELCSAFIPFEAIEDAHCTAGHRFGQFPVPYACRCINGVPVRCSFSLLAIQGPGLSKYCGICKRQALHEDSIRRLDGMDTDAAANGSYDSPSVIQVLSTAFDICLHCGGRFVG